MEIVNKKESSCRFDEIEKAKCFVVDVYPDSIFMRMQVVNSQYTFVAVDLTTGQIHAFCPGLIVTPIDAKIEIG